MEQSAERFGKAMSGSFQAATRAGDGLFNKIELIRTAMVAYVGFLGLEELGEVSDKWVNVEARIRLTVNTVSDLTIGVHSLKDALSDVYNISNATGMHYEQIGDLFQKIGHDLR